MKPYEFSLERIRSYKVQVLDKEKKTLGNLKGKRDEIAERLCALESFFNDNTAQLQKKQCEGVSMGELASLNFLIEHTRNRIELLQYELIKAEEVVEAQRKVVLTIYQEKTGMDKLEERQVEEYRLLEAKATESEVMQAISNGLAKMNPA